ncbi:MAG: c-type cytochrome [Mariprofundaceae bacterium]|nr:c-type cytochrome [Mariprofundaceae bacterium]
MIRLPSVLWRVCIAFVLLWSSNAYAGAYDGFKAIEKNNCSSCHNLTGQVGLKTASLWRKGPALYYAGSKYNQRWVEKWLQNPTRIRPSGIFYLDHAQTGKKWDTLRKDSLEPHVRLNAKDARNVAMALAEFTANSALIRTEKHDSSISAGAMGDLMFDKVNGCMACHSIEPGYGGLSGPELYTAGERLKPEYMLSFIRSPMEWNRKTWMPTRALSEENMQKLVNYIISLGEGSNKADTAGFSEQSAAKNYRVYCMQCHGISGKGAGINARDMAVPPRNHGAAKYLVARTDKELFKAIKEGGLALNKSALMPPWGGTLSDSEIEDLVVHIRKLCKCKHNGVKK